MDQTNFTSQLVRGTRRLMELRNPDAHWEGEDIWNSMLAVQYALSWHIMERPLSEARKRRLLLQFKHEQLPCGLWGMHRFGKPSLFMSVLVYVASRTLGVDADDPFLAPARRFFEEEDVLSIPSWGKVWLSLMNLYAWEGVNAVPPELWLAPKKFPLHPFNYYCHTRLIYMGMASVFGLKLCAARNAFVDELRAELYPGRTYTELDFRGARHRLREGDLWEAPTRTLRAMYDAINFAERFHRGSIRRRCLARLRDAMHFELQSSEYTCLSPVNGLLFMLTLWAWDKKDPVLEAQIERFDGWIWEDDTEGLRVCGARSATWDSSFALQALSAARPLLDKKTRKRCDETLFEGLAWLTTQQMQGPTTAGLETYRRAGRVNPQGGFCFAGVWHGWPVSDCTAEALMAFFEAPTDIWSVENEVIERGVRFLLQCQNPDGGFGSYEARKNSFDLEWMNPAEMFGDSMTELSYMECTSSNLIALSEVRRRMAQKFDEGLRKQIDRAIQKAEACLRKGQRSDGSWPGAWGVCFLYGTMFGVRGLLAAGASVDDSALRRARDFIKLHQRTDGSWGEHWRSCLSDRYEDLDHGHVVQTAWALLALLYAGEKDFGVLSQGAKWLATTQEENGDWPEQEFSGVFFRTALIEYRMYRRIFPVWALSAYEARRREYLDENISASEKNSTLRKPQMRV